MTYTYCASPFNSTPFSACCGVASMDSHCSRCGEEIFGHSGTRNVRGPLQDSCCRMCGSPRGNPAIDGNCHC